MRPLCWIGIDPSYSGYGLVRLHDDDTCYPQKLVFTPELAGRGSQRLDLVFRILQEKFETIYTCFDVKAVAVEGYAMGAKFGRELAGELGGVTRVLSMRELRREPVIVSPSALKKFVTGNHKATKDDMKASITQRWGEVFASHDIADAYGAARVAKAFTRGTTVEHEREVLAVLKQS